MQRFEIDAVDPSLRPFLKYEVRRKRALRQTATTLIGGPLMALIMGLLLYAASPITAGEHGARVPWLRILLHFEPSVPFGSAQVVALVLGLGIPTSLLVLVAEALVRRTRHQSLLVTLFAHGLIYGAMLTLSLAFVFVALSESRMSGASEVMHAFWLFFWTGKAAILYGVCFVTFAAVRFWAGLKAKIGPRVFGRWLRGHYYTPRTERRIFMFLDMNSSTALAEQLGDEKYSSLLRDYYADITGPIEESDAEVVHYVGDEIVLSWHPSVGLEDGRCLRCFYHFKAVLQAKRRWYEEAYGEVPCFKAGAHIGSVVATEVGRIKSELVFHGDVMNTSARIQAHCGELGTELLISQTLADQLGGMSWASTVTVGEVPLKGKHAPELLMKVRLKDAEPVPQMAVTAG